MICFCLVIVFWFFCQPSFHIYADDTKYCKQGIYLWLCCGIEALELIIFQVEWFSEVRICLLLFFVGCFVVVVCGFMVTQVVSSRFLHVARRFRSFLARCRSSHVVSCSLQVASRRFWSFQVVPRFSKYLIHKCFLFCLQDVSLHEIH